MLKANEPLAYSYLRNPSRPTAKRRRRGVPAKVWLRHGTSAAPPDSGDLGHGRTRYPLRSARGRRPRGKRSEVRAKMFHVKHFRLFFVFDRMLGA
jgi:hypothetical protein